jgi:hypothetical protein
MTDIENCEIRLLEASELDTVSGGDITGAVSTVVNAVAKGVVGLMDALTGGGNSFPIKIDFSGAKKAGDQLGKALGGRPA